MNTVEEYSQYNYEIVGTTGTCLTEVDVEGRVDVFVHVESAQLGEWLEVVFESRGNRDARDAVKAKGAASLRGRELKDIDGIKENVRRRGYERHTRCWTRGRGERRQIVRAATRTGDNRYISMAKKPRVSVLAETGSMTLLAWSNEAIVVAASGPRLYICPRLIQLDNENISRLTRTTREDELMNSSCTLRPCPMLAGAYMAVELKCGAVGSILENVEIVRCF